MELLFYPSFTRQGDKYLCNPTAYDEPHLTGLIFLENHTSFGWVISLSDDEVFFINQDVADMFVPLMIPVEMPFFGLDGTRELYALEPSEVSDERQRPDHGNQDPLRIVRRPNMDVQTGTPVLCQDCGSILADRKLVVDHELFDRPTYMYLCNDCLDHKPELLTANNVQVYLYLSPRS